MGWLKTHALLVALGALALLAPATVALFFLWRGAAEDARAAAARIEQVIEAEARADAARDELNRIEARAGQILDTLEDANATLPDDVRAALERLRELGAAPAQ